MEKHHNRRIVAIILSILLLVGLFFLTRWILHNIFYVSTDDAQVKSNLVGVSSKVAAHTIFLGAEEGDNVSKGEVLARLDGRDLTASLAQAEEAAKAAILDETRFAEELSLQKREVSLRINLAGDSLESSRNRLEISEEDLAMQEETARADAARQKASLTEAEELCTQAKALFLQASRDDLRVNQLFNKGAISKQAREQSVTSLITTQSKYQAALDSITQQKQLFEMTQAHLRTIQIKKSQYLNARTEVSSSASNLELAHISARRVDLDRQKLSLLTAKRKEAEAKVTYYRTILKEVVLHAPVSGRVARRNINLGEVTTPGAPLYYLVESGRLWVMANIEEARIRRVRPGAEVNVQVDAYPNHPFQGRVEFIGAAASSEFSLFPSDNPTGNFIKIAHRIPVKIQVEDPEGLLKPGMNVVVDIRAGRETNGAREGTQATSPPRIL